jgi:undecaprenyl-phosphate glucose phosphotransferase
VHRVVTTGPILLLDTQRHPLGARGIFIKSTMDYCLAAVLIVVFAPLMALIAVAIKLDSEGPVLFVQARSGYRQRVINVIKFRSMTVMENGPVIVQAEPDDPRITRVGRFLRRTSLDELPQLINVLRGQLSLVGPRPHAVAHDKHYGAIVELYASRSKIKPGITGLAQVKGFRSGTRDPEMMRQRVRLDILYIDNWSPGLDIKILFRTIRVVLWDRHAY